MIRKDCHFLYLLFVSFYMVILLFSGSIIDYVALLDTALKLRYLVWGSDGSHIMADCGISVTLFYAMKRLFLQTVLLKS